MTSRQRPASTAEPLGQQTSVAFSTPASKRVFAGLHRNSTIIRWLASSAPVHDQSISVLQSQPLANSYSLVPQRPVDQRQQDENGCEGSTLRHGRFPRSPCVMSFGSPAVGAAASDEHASRSTGTSARKVRIRPIISHVERAVSRAAQTAKSGHALVDTDHPARKWRARTVRLSHGQRCELGPQVSAACVASTREVARSSPSTFGETRRSSWSSRTRTRSFSRSSMPSTASCTSVRAAPATAGESS